MCRRKVGVVPPKKNWGPKNFYICSVFRRLRRLMANICWTKCDTDNRARALESAKGLLHCRKISRTLVHKWLKTGPEFLPTLTIYAIPSGGLKWQYIAIIATFSSWLCKGKNCCELGQQLNWYVTCICEEYWTTACIGVVSYGAVWHMPPLTSNSNFFRSLWSCTKSTAASSLFSAALKTCEIGNERRSIFYHAWKAPKSSVFGSGEAFDAILDRLVGHERTAPPHSAPTGYLQRLVLALGLCPACTKSWQSHY